MPILIGILAGIPVSALTLWLVSAHVEATTARNRDLSALSDLPYSQADSRGGCDRRGNDVYACAMSERTLRAEATALWRRATPAQRFACAQGVNGTYGPVSQIHSCLKGCERASGKSDGNDRPNFEDL